MQTATIVFLLIHNYEYGREKRGFKEKWRHHRKQQQQQQKWNEDENKNKNRILNGPCEYEELTGIWSSDDSM